MNKQSGTGGATKQQQQSKIKKSNLIATDILHVEDEAAAVAADVSNKLSNKDNEEDDEGDIQDNVSGKFPLLKLFRMFTQDGPGGTSGKMFCWVYASGSRGIFFKIFSLLFFFFERNFL